jgi:hypothetical protein
MQPEADMIATRFAAIAAALVTLTAVPCSPSFLGESSASRSAFAVIPGHLVVDYPQHPYSLIDRSLGWRLRVRYGDAWSRVPAYARFLKQRGRLSPAWQPQWDGTLLLRVGGRLYNPTSITRATRQFGGGAITFAYSGWTAPEQQQLSAYVNAVYPVISSIYGAPASTITVTIVQDPSLQSILGGVYVPALNEIHLPPIRDFARDSYVLASLIVRAFHDDLYLAYDVWETGFARAVALIAQLQISPSFDLSAEPYYLLPFYDLLNQRPLASPTLLPASGYAAMMPWRVGMAQAAWLKAYAENPAFFRDFNAAYYAEYNPAATPPLSQNVTRLRELAELAAPQVEGMGFPDWFARQFVLDTDGWPGEKLFLVALPQVDNVTVFLEADYYRATVNGDERPLSTTGSLQYIGWSGKLYSPEAGTTIPIQSGQGFLSPSFINVGGAQRILVELAAGAQVVASWFPYGVAATAGAHNEYFGVVADADEGTVNVMPPGIPTPVANVIRGVFSVSQPAPLDSLAQTAVEYQPVGGLANLRLVNTGPLFYVFMLRAHPMAPGAVTHTLPAGLSMVGLPESPDESDAAKILDLPPNQTLLARWSPTLAGGYRYVFYPDTPPVEPGLGYWLSAAAPLAVTAHGLLPTGEYRLHLRQGWHQIANPFSTAAPLTSVTVKFADGAPMTLAQAEAAGIVSVPMRYVAGAYSSAANLPPYEGLWIRVAVSQGCWLIIQEP